MFHPTLSSLCQHQQKRPSSRTKSKCAILSQKCQSLCRKRVDPCPVPVSLPTQTHIHTHAKGHELPFPLWGTARSHPHYNRNRYYYHTTIPTGGGNPDRIDPSTGCFACMYSVRCSAKREKVVVLAVCRVSLLAPFPLPPSKKRAMANSGFC